VTTDSETLVLDLVERTQRAVEKVAAAAEVDGTELRIRDVVQAVEDDLPDGFPAAVQGGASRRVMVARVAADILSGELARTNGRDRPR
jgi:glycerol kinase